MNQVDAWNVGMMDPLHLSSASDWSEALVFSRICPAGPDLLGPAFGAGFVQRRHA